MSGQIAESEHRVTPLELFFDLVFVFAFTQVTTLLLEDVTWAGLGRGLLVLAVLWWAWGELCVADEHGRRGRGVGVGRDAGGGRCDVRGCTRSP